MPMESKTPMRREPRCRIGAFLVGVFAALSLCLSLSAAETNAAQNVTAGSKAPPATNGTNATPAAAPTNAPPEAPEAPEPLTPEQMFEGGTNVYGNWVDLGFGGFWTGGNKSQAEAMRRASPGAFGGIEDFRYQKIIDKTTLTIDGRALFDQNDYKVSLDARREELGWVRVSYDEFRTWYNGDGGYYRPANQWYPLRGDALALDRGNFSFEGGLTLKDIPEVTFKYSHAFRDGEKSSTIWGITHPGIGVTQGLSPSFYNIDEHSDAFQLDLAKTIKATDLGLGMRYEAGELDNSLYITQSPREPGQQRITDTQKTSYDLFNVHGFTETRFRKNLVLSSGYAYSGVDNDLSGSRIYGADFDAGFTPAAQNGAGYYGLTGNSHLDEYVFNLNLMYRPLPVLAIVPSMRFQEQVMDADSSGFQTLADAAPVPYDARSDADRFDVRERLDVNFTGLTNSTLYARGEWTQGSGDLSENGGRGPVNGSGLPPVQRETDDSRFFQKYSAGIRWYPTRRAILDLGGDYKINRYDYDHDIDSTANDVASGNRYPAYLVMQDIESYGGKTRVSLRPLQNVTLVTRYEYQRSTIQTKPAEISGLDEVESSEMHSHILAQDVSWTPWARLNLQAGLNYVWSTTTTPASDYTRAVLDAQNNYWTVNFSSVFVVDDKTDLNLGYLYYRADNYENNSAFSVPYGAGAEEHSVSAGITRRLRQNIRLFLRYAYSHYGDETFGGNGDYDAHMVSCTLRYLF
jgi:hypothetical protein